MIGVAIFFALLGQTAAFAGQFEDGKAAADIGDSRAAMKLLQPLAEQGNANAQFEVGMLYDSDASVAKVSKEMKMGDGSFGTEEQDNIEAAKWFRKAADQGHARAQYDVAMGYQEGKGVEKDLAEAEKWLRKSANQGDAWAQLAIGVMYEKGESVKQDLTQAYMWFSLASVADPNGAVGNGARSHGDAIAAKMTSEQVAEGKRLAGEWKPTPASSRQ